MKRLPCAVQVALLALSLVLFAALTGCSSAGGPSPSSSGLNDQTGAGPYQGVGLEPARPRPSFTLTDTSGARFPFGDRTGGHPTLLYFGYTRCPDICPATMADIALALKKLPMPIQRKTYVVFVSTDVKHDTGPVLGRWLKNFAAGQHAKFVGLRGTKAQIDAAQAAAHVFLAEDGGQTHSAQVLLYGSDDYARVSFVYDGTGEQAQIEHDLPLVAG
ncbi:MAG: SCO family protein [Actinomycetota bacterium]|nr:SCO family protein [Actinomycetota bacterium]